MTSPASGMFLLPEETPGREPARVTESETYDLQTMASNRLAKKTTCDGLQPNSDDLQPNSDGLQPIAPNSFPFAGSVKSKLNESCLERKRSE